MKLIGNQKHMQKFMQGFMKLLNSRDTEIVGDNSTKITEWDKRNLPSVDELTTLINCAGIGVNLPE